MVKYAKVLISGELTADTGLHIGTGAGFSAIGATDKPVIKDPLTRLPVIPGSSLKGKMRSLLSRKTALEESQIAESPDQDSSKIRRVFGDTVEFMSGRLIFRDSKLSNKDELEKRGAKTLTEVKFENSIDRITSVANPRQIERVISGSKFNFELVYEAKGNVTTAGEIYVPDAEEIKEDFELIIEGLKLLSFDYLGGHGSRGYGRVSFSGLTAEVVVGEVADDLLKVLNDQLSNL